MKGKFGKNNPLFKKPRAKVIREKISRTKLNYPENNGNFKGYYQTPFGVFGSSPQIAKQLGVNHTTIIKWCKNSKSKIRRQSIDGSNRLLKIADIGKTYSDLGWDFKKTAGRGLSTRS